MQRLAEMQVSSEHLDGDVVRDLVGNRGFSKESRNSHVKQMGFIASVLERHGISVVTSFVSPYEESRDFVRGICRNFVEIHVATLVQEV